MGGISDIVATNIFTLPVVLYILTSFGVARVPKDQMQAAYVAVVHANLGLYVLLLTIGVACSVLGGYIAAWIAKHDELLNGTLSSWLCVGSGIYALAAGKSLVALPESLLLLAAGVAAAAFGGYLRLAQNRARKPLSA